MNNISILLILLNYIICHNHNKKDVQILLLCISQ